MPELLSIAEIRTRCAAEWVLLEDPEVGADSSVQSGKLLSHSKDRDEVYREALKVRPRHSAILYTGEIPDNAVIILCAFSSTPSAD
jgi:hypothetical protein